MNVANLQLQGLLLVIAELVRLLKSKGLVSELDVDTALRRAEAAASGDDRFQEGLSLASRDAICLAARLLRVANASAEPVGYAELAREVGLNKTLYNDQR